MSKKDDKKDKPIENNVEPLEPSLSPLLFAAALVTQLHERELAEIKADVLELSKVIPGDPISNPEEITEQSKTPRKK